VQRLQRDLERAVPRAGAQVPRVQLVQHPGDEGCVPQDLRRTRGYVKMPGRCRPTTGGDHLSAGRCCA
jgi:hypothetical protein